MAAIRTIGIADAIVALLAGIERAVSAEWREEAAICTAGIGKRWIVECGFALFAEELLHDVVAAETIFEQALHAARIAIALVAIVTFFPWINVSITAERGDGIRPWQPRTRNDKRFFFLTHGRAAVACEHVAVITIFMNQIEVHARAIPGDEIIHGAISATRPLAAAWNGDSGRKAAIGIGRIAPAASAARAGNAVTRRRIIRALRAVITPFADRHHAVSTPQSGRSAGRSIFQSARCRAPVTRFCIAIITLFTRIKYFIAARNCGLAAANGGATVAVLHIPIIAIFANKIEVHGAILIRYEVIDESVSALAPYAAIFPHHTGGLAAVDVIERTRTHRPACSRSAVAGGRIRRADITGITCFRWRLDDLVAAHRSAGARNGSLTR